MIATQVGQGKKRIGLISTGIVGALLVAFTFTPTFGHLHLQQYRRRRCNDELGYLFYY